ncbi:unnamed protein product [Phytomonas sp. Hart1]|nr:unnamed protein product [Phytomonas sp. Hart1]|eukprot:CCW66682.1 unnamed protein product [Phytomonas sp. isolate Hart1]
MLWFVKVRVLFLTKRTLERTLNARNDGRDRFRANDAALRALMQKLIAPSSRRGSSNTTISSSSTKSLLDEWETDENEKSSGRWNGFAGHAPREPKKAHSPGHSTYSERVFDGNSKAESVEWGWDGASTTGGESSPSLLAPSSEPSRQEYAEALLQLTAVSMREVWEAQNQHFCLACEEQIAGMRKILREFFAESGISSSRALVGKPPMAGCRWQESLTKKKSSSAPNIALLKQIYLNMVSCVGRIIRMRGSLWMSLCLAGIALITSLALR